jgi:hypothetical protein
MMTDTLKVAQLVYANVEAEKSPRKKRGFQTLYQTRVDGLSPPEVLDIESRLSYETRDYKGDRYLYFTTKLGKFACVRFTVLEGVDRFNRKGLYLAHALVFDATSFESIDNNPFDVFLADPSPFFTDLDRAIEAGSLANGQIPHAIFPIGKKPKEPRGLPESVSEEAFRWLVLAGLQAKKLKDLRKTITLHGDPDIVFDTLHAVISALPRQRRAECSFDTFGNRQTADRSMLWAVGLTDALAARPGLLPVPLDKRATFRETVPLKSETPFDRWAEWALKECGPAILGRDGKKAWRLAESLKNCDSSSLHSIDLRLIEAFLASNRRASVEGVLESISKVMGCKPPGWLSQRAKLWIDKESDPIKKMEAWISGLKPTMLVDWTLEHLATHPREHLGGGFYELSTETKDERLHLIRALDRSDWEKLRNALPNRDWESEEDARFLGLLLKRVGIDLSLCVHHSPAGETFGCLGGFARSDAGKALGLVALLMDESPERVEPEQSYKELDPGIAKVDSQCWKTWCEVSINKAARIFPPSFIGWRFLPMHDGFMIGFHFQAKDSLLESSHLSSVYICFNVRPAPNVLPHPALVSNSKGTKGGKRVPPPDGNLWDFQTHKVRVAFQTFCRQLDPKLRRD